MDASLAALSCSLGSTTTWDCLTIHTGSKWFANKWKHGCQKTQESWAQSQQNFSLCHIMQWNCYGSIAEEKELVSKHYTCGTNDKTVNHVEQKCPVWTCHDLHKFAACQRHNTRCHRMPQKQISIWLYLLMMTDSYAWFQSSASSQINFGSWAPSLQKSEIINVSNLGLRFFLLNSLGRAVLGAACS